MFNNLQTDHYFVNVKHYVIAFYLWENEPFSTYHRLVMQELFPLWSPLQEKTEKTN